MYFRFILSITALFVVILYSCNAKNDKPTTTGKGKKPVAIDVMRVTTQKFSHTIEANGTVLAHEFVELKPDVSGRIVMLNIREGSMVAEGTLLAKLFDDDLQAQLRKNTASLEIATRNEQRLKTLLIANGLNQQEYDQALTQLNVAKADIDFTKAQIRKTEIRAPFSGVVGLRNVSNGAYVSTSNVLATLQQFYPLKIDFVVPESDAKEIKVGKTIRVRSSESSDDMVATVMAIEPQVSTANRSLKARAVIKDAKVKLNPGSFVNVQLQQGGTNAAILVPTNCIIPESRNNKVVVVKDGKAVFQVVQIGYRDETNVEITNGLMAGDTIALNGILYLKPDAPVNIRSVKNVN